MVYKRPFHDEESFEVGFKHPRQEGHSAQQSPILGFLPSNDGPALSSDEGQDSARKSQDGNVAKESASEDFSRVSNELELNAPGSSSSFFEVNGNAFNEYAESDAAVHLSFFPHFFKLDRVMELVQPHGIYSFLLNHPPRKLVSVGPDHQADVPEGASKRFHESSASLDQSDPHIIPGDSSGSRVMDDDDNEAGLVGTCVVPMPDMESSAYSCCADKGRRSNCNCLDRGSIRCVRQHVMEVREELRENLGQKAFEEFGFCDMGEEVARKWREDEEHTFRDVLSNAASQSKNIWDHLSATFPSRTKKELVSYYFNVFVLRKRAEQNRFDPLKVDSDNDEWQKSELVMTDEEDDTTCESLDTAPAHCQDNSEEEFLKGIVEDSGAGTCKGDTDTVDTSCIMSNKEGGGGDIDDGL